MKVKNESSRRNFLRTAAVGSVIPFTPGILHGEIDLSNPLVSNQSIALNYHLIHPGGAIFRQYFAFL